MGRRPDRGDEFYDACDRAGILVWQEFVQSSSGIESVPPPTRVRRRWPPRRGTSSRSGGTIHRSLLWCGGNELADGGRWTTPVLAALRDVVTELDPDRAWLPTSPGAAARHDVHGPWEHQGLRDHNAHYDAGTSLLASEFGVEGMANRRRSRR